MTGPPTWWIPTPRRSAEYAILTLVVALVNVGFAMAPLGMDGIVVRHHLEAGPRLLRKVLLATTLTR